MSITECKYPQHPTMQLCCSHERPDVTSRLILAKTGGPRHRRLRVAAAYAVFHRENPLQLEQIHKWLRPACCAPAHVCKEHEDLCRFEEPKPAKLLPMKVPNVASKSLLSASSHPLKHAVNYKTWFHSSWRCLQQASECLQRFPRHLSNH